MIHNQIGCQGFRLLMAQWRHKDKQTLETLACKKLTKSLQMENSKEEKRPLHEFDSVFKFIKPFGLYQHMIYWFVSALKIPMGFQFAYLIFTYGTQKFECTTANVTCPVNKCCQNCTTYSFDTSFVSVVTEWRLICDRAHVAAIIQSTFFWGMLIGSITGGWLSDAFGRKKCIFGSLLIMSSVSLGSAFTNSEIALGILRFLAGFSLAAVMLAQFTYLVELVGPSKRTFAAMATQLLWKPSEVVTVAFAYAFPYWRHMVIAGSITGFLFLPFYKLIPESPRWLVAHGRLDEAQVILKKFGAKDNKALDEELLRATLESVRKDQLENEKKRKMYHITDMFRTPRMRRFSLIVCYNWFVVAMVYFAMFMFVSRLSGSIYVNATIMHLIDIPAILLGWFMVARFGRRIPYAITMVLSGLALIILSFIPKDFPKVATTFALLGKCLMGVEFVLVYIITSELFPTVVRNLSMGAGSMTGRAGAIIAPFFIMMAQLPGISLILPLCIFGGLAIIAACLALLLPETLSTNMEQTIEAAEVAQLDYSIPCCKKKTTRTELEVPDVRVALVSQNNDETEHVHVRSITMV